MIASLRGTLSAQSGTRAVIEVGGVGYQVTAHPDATLAIPLGGDIFVHTMQIFREDAQVIFAFCDEPTRDLFALLQSVSGIGPKLAFTMLTTYSNERLVAAILNKDEAALKKIPGVGAKGAARISLELADKLNGFSGTATPQDSSVLEALVGLGWPAKLADEVLSKLLASEPELTQNPSALLRAALSALGR